MPTDTPHETPSPPLSRALRAARSPRELGTRLRGALRPPVQKTRRRDLLQTLLSFPEHDAATVAALLQQYGGDREKVAEKLRQVRSGSTWSGSPGSVDRWSEGLAEGRWKEVSTSGGEEGKKERRIRKRLSEDSLSSFGKSEQGSEISANSFERKLRGTKRQRSTEIEAAKEDGYMERHISYRNVSKPLSQPLVEDTILPAAAADIQLQYRSDDVDLWDGNYSTRIQKLSQRIEKLELELIHFLKQADQTRRELHARLNLGEAERLAAQRRHTSLEHELAENQRRGILMEEYLDRMRRDLVRAVAGRQSRLGGVARAAVHGVLYYILAYLVPVLAAVVGALRDALLWLRRR